MKSCLTALVGSSSNVTEVTYCRVMHGAGELLGETLSLRLPNCNFNGNGKLMRVVYWSIADLFSPRH